MSYTNILRRSEMQMFFLCNRIEMEGKQYLILNIKQTNFVMLHLKDTAAFMSQAATYCNILYGIVTGTNLKVMN